MKKAPFNSFMFLDYLEVRCPCGESIKGEGQIIENFFKTHKKHTNGKCQENVMGECYKILSGDTPSQRIYKIK